jgi:cell fate regulator YaaT (PSP1 superfamily)
MSGGRERGEAEGEGRQRAPEGRGFRIKKEPQQQAAPGRPCRRTVGVRLRYGGNIQIFECGDLDLEMGVWVVVKHNDVTRIGMVTSMPVRWGAPGGPGAITLPADRELLRVATIDDLSRQAENQLLERDEFEFCHSRIRKLGLPMKLVTVEITFDNYKSIFYYTSEERVDFRQLVRDLVRRLRTRVEMRQISVRHEALMLGGMGMCGRELCCSSFLKNFTPVSVRMAKEQRLSINTVKISGVCGRLMCCLAFESPHHGLGHAARVAGEADGDAPSAIGAEGGPGARPMRLGEGQEDALEEGLGETLEEGTEEALGEGQDADLGEELSGDGDHGGQVFGEAGPEGPSEGEGDPLPFPPEGARELLDGAHGAEGVESFPEGGPDMGVPVQGKEGVYCRVCGCRHIFLGPDIWSGYRDTGISETFGPDWVERAGDLDGDGDLGDLGDSGKDLKDVSGNGEDGKDGGGL